MNQVASSTISDSKTRILFVDDEAEVLDVLRFVLGSMSGQWAMSFVQSGPQALALMDQQPFEIIVADTRMPGMTGPELLNEVLKRHPRTVRIIMAGFADEEAVTRSVGGIHQCLSKPFDLQTLRSTLDRIRRLNARLASDEMRALVTHISCLPSLPNLYFQIIEASQSADCSTQRMGEIVSTDPALSARILQLVNSAFFGFFGEVSDTAEAVQLLGLGRIRSLALSVHLFSAWDSSRCNGCSVEQIWDHSLRTAVLAGKLAALETRNENVEERAFTAGLLHDIGKLILAANLSAPYGEVMARAHSGACSLVQAELDAFRVTHADVGAYLLGIWGLPPPLVEAVAWHHDPVKAGDRRFGPTTAVHVANAIVRGENDPVREAMENQIDYDYLAQLGLQDRVSVWERQLAT